MFHEIALFLRRSRYELDISQAELARRIGRCSQYVSNIERALCSIPEDEIFNFSEALEVLPDKIIEAMTKDYMEKLYVKSEIQKCNKQNLNAQNVKQYTMENAINAEIKEGIY